MAKTTAKKKQVAPVAKKQEVAASNVDASLMMRQDAGKGVSTSAEDNIIPLIYVLQSLSKQVLKQRPEYIKGAAAGNIWPRGSSILIDGEEGMPVIPCGMRKWWVEWKPDRGGFVARHEYVEKDDDKGRPADAEQVEDPKTGGKLWVRENGNVLVETREHAVLALIEDKWSPFVIAMSGSNHSVARNWNGEWLRKRLPAPNNDFVPASYAFVYNLKTIATSNDKGDWYKWAYENGTGDGEEVQTTSLEDGMDLYRMARTLNEAFMAGVKQGDAPTDETSDGDHGDL